MNELFLIEMFSQWMSTSLGNILVKMVQVELGIFLSKSESTLQFRMKNTLLLVQFSGQILPRIREV